MNPKTLEKYLSRFKGVEGSFPFGPDALVFKVVGKMFALVTRNEAVTRLTVKCIPQDGEILTGQFESIIPGYHMNKRHWITIYLNGELPDAMIKELAEKSYQLVVSKLPKTVSVKLDAT